MKTKRLLTKITTTLLASVMVLLQTACLDLVGLKEFTDESVKAGAKFKELAVDNHRSCASEVYYETLRNSDFRQIRIFESADTFMASLPGDQQNKCAGLETSAANFVAANKILMTYLYVMGRLAGDDVASADKQFKEMKDALDGLPGTSPPEFTAALSIANTITNILLESQRQKAIKKAILASDADVKTVTEGISDYLKVYIERLERERDDGIKRAYRAALNHHEAFNASFGGSPRSDALTVMTGTVQIEAAVQTLNTRIRAAKAYQKVLADVRDGHHELFVEAERGFNRKAAIRIALKYGPSIEENFEELKKAFQ